MEKALIVAIVFGSFVLIPAVIGGTIVISIKLLRGGTSRKDQAEDSKIIQEIYQGLSRMEHRVEALETILLDRDKGDRQHEKL
jgi:phage shock protein B